MPPEAIRSPSNPLIKRMRKLRRRKQRAAQGAFVVEGIAPVLAALEHSAAEVVVVAPELLDSNAARRRLAELEGLAHVVEVSAEVLATVTERDHPVGIAAIARQPTVRLRDLPVAEDSLFVALDGVGNPGNLGTIIRTVDAVRGGGVIVTGESTDPWHPGAVKASMGAIFSVPLCLSEHVSDPIAWARDRAISVVTTSAHAPVAHYEAPWEAPALLVFGSEGAGLPTEVIERGDVAVRIPMAGGVTSLNLAVAVGILLYEARRPS